jgi:hypothetical protein
MSVGNVNDNRIDSCYTADFIISPNMIIYILCRANCCEMFWLQHDTVLRHSFSGTKGVVQ